MIRFSRTVQIEIERVLARGKSVLLLGPRQTGKSTLAESLRLDLSISLLLTKERNKYEKDPDSLLQEVEALSLKKPLVLIDEIQKIPKLIDVIQYIVDKKKAQFILTGSSARRIKQQSAINLLPGRVVLIRMDALSLDEIAEERDIKKLIEYGSLPAIYLQKKKSDKEEDLKSYVDLYLDEEVRKEALVRNLGMFTRFLESAALESGKIANYTSIGRDLGINHNTVSSYYQILEDCLIVERIDPYTKSSSRKKLTQSSRFLFFDSGVRRLASRESVNANPEIMGHWFESWVGMELVKKIRNKENQAKLSFWRDPDGPEVDWLILKQNEMIPIEVKWSEKTDFQKASKHLRVFLAEYPQAKKAFIISNVSRARKLDDQITVIPWFELEKIFD